MSKRTASGPKSRVTAGKTRVSDSSWIQTSLHNHFAAHRTKPASQQPGAASVNRRSSEANQPLTRMTSESLRRCFDDHCQTFGVAMSSQSLNKKLKSDSNSSAMSLDPRPRSLNLPQRASPPPDSFEDDLLLSSLGSMPDTLSDAAAAEESMQYEVGSAHWESEPQNRASLLSEDSAPAERPDESTTQLDPSFQHVILCTIPVSPSRDSQAGLSAWDSWDEHHVRLPCSEFNVFIDSSMRQTWRWALIRKALSLPIGTPNDLKEAILSYNPVHRRKWDFSGLMHYFSCRAKESRELFKSVIPFMTRLALELPKVLEQPIPLLKIGENKAITLSQRQIASLLANAFFCTFPRRNDHRKSSEYGTFPSIHFNLLFAGVPSSGECFPAQAAKLDGLFHYFRTIMRKDPQGTVTFQRRAVPPDCLPVWNECPELLSEMTVDAAGSIEDDGRDMLQLDFANKMIGGGVVGRGAVQEEIRFILSPELIVSRLFVEELQDYECVLIVGAQRYSRHQGYSSTFEWVCGYDDSTPRDNLGRRTTDLLAIDALYFRPSDAWRQYQRKSVIRELNKAYGGFLPSPVSSHDVATPIATGNWGCGAFNGDPQLKSLLQLMAASVAKRQLFYFTFGDYELCSQLRAIHTGLKEQMVTVGQLYDWIRAYFTNIVRANIESNSKISTTLYDYIWSQLE